MIDRAQTSQTHPLTVVIIDLLSQRVVTGQGWDEYKYNRNSITYIYCALCRRAQSDEWPMLHVTWFQGISANNLCKLSASARHNCA